MNNKFEQGVFKNLRYDLPASLVVFLVALPLCLGIAFGSSAPTFSGLIAGIVGGIIVASVSRSSLSVSGPAAGLITIVSGAITEFGTDANGNVDLAAGFKVFILAVAIAGLIQILLGFAKAGLIGSFFPSSVIKGMLAAIGLILILKQVPHAFGYDADYEGDESFVDPSGQTTFDQIINAFDNITEGAIIISSISLLILVLWERPFLKKRRFFSTVPAPLIVVLLGVGLNALFASQFPSLAISKEHMVAIDVPDKFSEYGNLFLTPDFSYLGDWAIYKVAITIAIVASLETLLSIDATDKLDPFKRITPLNRELKAQGMGNFISGMIGGLPITAVIVRSSANVNSGARSRSSAVIHGVLLLVTALLIPSTLNQIPLASLAAILLTVGYKLTRPALYIDLFKKGWDQFLPFFITVVAINLSDLLTGIGVGMVIGLLFVLRTNFHQAIFTVNKDGNYLIRLTKDVSFLNKALLRSTLQKLPENSYVIIDGTKSQFIDKDIEETIEDFVQTAEFKNIKVEIKRTALASNPLFQTKHKK
ncbi:MAG: SulP family inorganic anion transporter [Bacteroidota bacterium]